MPVAYRPEGLGCHTKAFRGRPSRWHVARKDLGAIPGTSAVGQCRWHVHRNKTGACLACSAGRKLPVKRVLSWAGPFICFASDTSINLWALIGMDGLRVRPPHHISFNRFCIDVSFRAAHASCPYHMPPAHILVRKLPVNRKRLSVGSLFYCIFLAPLGELSSLMTEGVPAFPATLMK